jgi:hypothetical protein
LDLDASKCPYCGQQIIWLDSLNWLDLSGKNEIIKNIKWNFEKSIGKKKTSWCGIFFIIFITIQIIWVILSIISQIISSLL